MTIDNSPPPAPEPGLPSEPHSVDSPTRIQPSMEPLEGDVEIPVPAIVLEPAPRLEPATVAHFGSPQSPPNPPPPLEGSGLPSELVDLVVKDTDGEELTDEDLIVTGLPAWLASVAINLGALIVVALIAFPIKKDKVLMVDAVFADRLGEQLDSDLLELSSPDALDLKTPVLAESSPIAVDDPFAAPPSLPITLDRGMLISEIPSVDVGVAFLGRTEGMKKSLLRAYGGTALTEEAVANALEWLRRNQEGYGSWSLRGPYADGATMENKVAATAMAMMAFEGAGHTHRVGKYKAEMDRALKWLLRQQQRNGSFYRGDSRSHRPYTEAMSIIALCELYGMTKDKTLHDPAQRAVNCAIKEQGRGGGWRYVPRQDSDTSVTGWYVMGLQSARAAGLDVPSDVFERVQKYLDAAAVDDGSRYGYIPGTFESHSMTAEALLCRQYMGWRPDDPRMLSGVEYIISNPIDWDVRDSYYWYYATQTLFHLGGYPWEEWNRQLRVILPERQEKVGDERGSWTNHGDKWGSAGGRLYATCLSTYMLEVYYRRMPLYSPVYQRGADPPIAPRSSERRPESQADAESQDPSVEVDEPTVGPSAPDQQDTRP